MFRFLLTRQTFSPRFIFAERYVNFECYPLEMFINDIGQDGCELVQKLNKDTSITFVEFSGNIQDPFVIKSIFSALKGTQVQHFSFECNRICSVGAKYLAKGFKDLHILTLQLYEEPHSSGIEYIPDIIKDSCITELYLEIRTTTNTFFKNLAESLKNTSIINLGIKYTDNEIDLLKYLVNALPETNITWLNLNIFCRWRDARETCVEQAEYIEKYLKNCCITHLYLTLDQINDNIVENLVRSLVDTQIYRVELAERWREFNTSFTHYRKAIDKNEKFGNEIQNAFKKLVIENIENDNLVFFLPYETENLDIGEYLDFIKTIIYNPCVKGHIFNLIVSLNSNSVRKITEFIETISDKFNALFNNHLIYLLEDFNCIELVKKCEDMGLHDILKNLLLHRHLYYIDDDQEILHPFIYKMLNKYGMTLYVEQIEPKKKSDIISYYQCHPEIDGAQDILDLLEKQQLF